jgi:hypothetical protein
MAPKAGTRWIVAALLSAVLACAWVAFAPALRDTTGELVVDQSGRMVAEYDNETFIQAYGAWVLLLLPIPIALAATPLARDRGTRTCALCGGALAVLALVASFSAGLYYVPSALLLLTGAGLAEWTSFKQSL